MNPVHFGYAGKWSPTLNPVQQAAYWVKSDPTPVGVEMALPVQGAQPIYRVVTQQEYQQAAQGGRLIWTAWA